VIYYKMKRHNYKEIKGWFDFADLYSEQVSLADDMAHFVEVGSFYGKSASFMGVEIANSNKQIRFDAIDLFEVNADPTTPQVQNDAYKACLKNVAHVKKYVNVIKNDSVAAAVGYGDNSLDFVFIDAEHTKDATLRDLRAWYPKVKSGGTIAGHDYFPWRINDTAEKNRAGVVHGVAAFIDEQNLDCSIVGNKALVVPEGYRYKRPELKLLCCSKRCFKIIKS